MLDHIVIGDDAFASIRSPSVGSQSWDTSYAMQVLEPAAAFFAGELVCTIGPLKRLWPATLRRKRPVGEG